MYFIVTLYTLINVHKVVANDRKTNCSDLAKIDFTTDPDHQPEKGGFQTYMYTLHGGSNLSCDKQFALSKCIDGNTRGLPVTVSSSNPQFYGTDH